jgi:cytochrome c oxidase subunit II
VTRFTLAAAVVVVMAAPQIGTPHAAAQAPGGEQTQHVTVRIVAERFRFSPDQIRIRRGATVEFHLESDDTDHGFRILGTDIDRVIPKRGRGEITVTFTPDAAGRYNFECSKLCGAGHEFMHGVVVVED